MKNAIKLSPRRSASTVQKATSVSGDRPLYLLLPEKFTVHDEATADWVVRKIVEAARQQKRVKQWAEAELRRTKAEEAWFRRRFERELSMWARRELDAQKGRRKSLNLPSGTIGFRRRKGRLTIEDTQAVLAWAKRHCAEAVRVVERLDKRTLRKHIADTGELPDTGVHLEPEREAFFVR